MNTHINHLPSSSLTLSMFISETIYRAVLATERLIHRFQK